MQSFLSYKFFSYLFLLLVVLMMPVSAHALSCNDLNSTEKTKQFIQNSYSSNPLMRKNVSLKMELDACEAGGCSSRQKRKTNRIKMSYQRLNKKNRIRFIKGNKAPSCLIQRNDRRLICSNCDEYSNENCRSYPSDDATVFPGTNIDLADFSMLSENILETKCSPLKKNKKFLKIDSILRNKTAEQSLMYDRVLSFYDKEKAVPITINFFKNKVLRKVYRFFPKYYLNIEGQWVSTVLRVRSTKGNEKKYDFETLIYVEKNNGKHLLYLDISKDPVLKDIPVETLFITD